MKQRRTIHSGNTTHYLFVLLVLSLSLAACGPDVQQAAFLANWTPDGSRVALVPNFLDAEPEVFGLWVHDIQAGTTTQIIASKDVICAHPQWSPSGEEILFAIIQKQGEDSNAGEKPIPFSVYAVGRKGQALRRVVDSVSASGETFLIPNLILWGPGAHTILFQQAQNDKVTVLQLDLTTGALTQYLPDLADLYWLEPSPDRQRVAAVLYDHQSETARVYVADFIPDNWRLVEDLKIDPDRAESFSPMIYWAPDSSRFIVPEKAGSAGGEGGQGGLRLFDGQTGASHRICAGDPSSAILWNREGSSFIFEERRGDSDAKINRVDLHSGTLATVVPDGGNHLLSWNHADGRIYFFRTDEDKDRVHRDERISDHRLFSCNAGGGGAQTLGQFLTKGNPCWMLSPQGNRMVFFDSTAAPGLVDLGAFNPD